MWMDASQRWVDAHLLIHSKVQSTYKIADKTCPDHNMNPWNAIYPVLCVPPWKSTDPIFCVCHHVHVDPGEGLVNTFNVRLEARRNAVELIKRTPGQSSTGIGRTQQSQVLKRTEPLEEHQMMTTSKA